MKAFSRKAVLLIVLLVVVSMLLATSSTEAVADNFPVPPWWSDDECDSVYYESYTGEEVDLLYAGWKGLQVCGPRPQGDPDLDAPVYFSYSQSEENEWECTELVKRYLLMMYSIPSIGNTHGMAVVENYASNYPDTFLQIENDGNTHILPKVGDVLSYDFQNGYGHTSIVRDVDDEGGGDATLYVIEQNGADNTGQDTLDVENWVIGGSVSDWLTPVWSILDDTTSGDSLRSVDALSSSNIWTVGPGYIQHSTNGTTWGSNEIPVAYQNYGLEGVEAISSNDVVAVGTVVSGWNKYAVALKYNGTNWVNLPITWPGWSSWFTSVSQGASGTTWGVGYYLSASGYLPLIEYYNGSRFTKISDPQDPDEVVSGSSDIRLLDVSGYSEYVAWAVGYYRNASNLARPLLVQGNGSTWTYVETPLPTVPQGTTLVHSKLQSVVVVAADDVWAGGFYQYNDGVSQPVKPFVLHYDGSDWTEINPELLTEYGEIYDMAAGDDSTVYAVGYTAIVGDYHSKPVVMRYDTTAEEWIEVSVPYDNQGEIFYGITVLGPDVDDPIWAVGGKTNTHHLIQIGSVQ